MRATVSSMTSVLVSYQAIRAIYNACNFIPLLTPIGHFSSYILFFFLISYYSFIL